MADSLRVAVLGAGAVGTFLGGSLELGGQNVCLIGRDRVLDPVRLSGLRIEAAGTPFRLVHPNTCTEPEALSQSFDIVLLTVKAYSVESALSPLRSLLGQSGFVVTLQNGVGSDRLLLDAFGPERVVAATLTVSVGLTGEATVTRFSRSGGLAYSSYANGSAEGPASRLLSKAGLPLRHVQRPDSLRWSKLILNSIGGAQSAILDEAPARIMADLRLFRIEQLAARETSAAMRAARIPIVDLPGYPVRLASKVMSLPPFPAHALLQSRIGHARGGRSPAIRADVQQGGPTENRYLNGAVVELGFQHGIPTPVNRCLFDLVDEVTESKPARQRYRHDPESLLGYARQRGIKL